MNKNAFWSETQLLQPMVGEESKKEGGWGRHMVQERGVVSLSSSPAVSQSTRIPWHRWDGVWVGGWLWVYVCVIRHLCHGRWWWNTLGMAPLRALPSTQQDKYTLILSPSHKHTHADCTFTHIDIRCVPTPTHKHTESTGCPRQGSLSAVCQSQTRALYSSHINNGPIWTGL